MKKRKAARTSRPFWVRVGFRVRGGDRGGVGSTPVPWSRQEALPNSLTRAAYRLKDPYDQIVGPAHCMAK